MSEHFVAGVTLSTIECYKCHCIFAIPREMNDRLLKTHDNFFCPAGHAQHYLGLTPEQKLQRELDEKQRQLEREEARAARLKTERDQVARAHSRMRVRVMNGVCPCCNRTFQNLMRHMKTEHAGDLNLANVRQAFGMTQADIAREVGVAAHQVSLYERGKPVSSWARSSLDRWVEKQATQT
jgi:DNA-binding XRE family transcriptional regulator